MVSVRDIKIAEELFILFLAYIVIKQVGREALWITCIEVWGACFTSEFSLFSVMAGWIVRCFSCCSLLLLLCNRQNLAAVGSVAYNFSFYSTSNETQ